MHCPRCATTSTPNQQFCRSCGLRLDKIAELMGEEMAVQTPPSIEVARLRERQKKFEDLAGIAGLATFGLVLLLLFILVFVKMILPGGFAMIPGVMLILLAIGAGTMVGFQIYSKTLKEKLEERPLPPASDAPSIGASDPAQLPAYSVSEGTTELLTAKSPETGKIS